MALSGGCKLGAALCVGNGEGGKRGEGALLRVRRGDGACWAMPRGEACCVSANERL